MNQRQIGGSIIGGSLMVAGLIIGVLGAGGQPPSYAGIPCVQGGACRLSTLVVGDGGCTGCGGGGGGGLACLADGGPAVLACGLGVGGATLLDAGLVVNGESYLDGGVVYGDLVVLGDAGVRGNVQIDGEVNSSNTPALLVTNHSTGTDGTTVRIHQAGSSSVALDTTHDNAVCFNEADTACVTYSQVAQQIVFNMNAAGNGLVPNGDHAAPLGANSLRWAWLEISPFFSVGTCGVGSEGTIQASGGGGSGGIGTKLCFCRSDGAGNYVWENIADGGSMGTSTTCI